jgi:hypothetical protein
MLVPAVDSQRRDFRDDRHSPARELARELERELAREKAGGRYATGLLLQLPAREVRFRCDSMPKV